MRKPQLLKGDRKLDNIPLFSDATRRGPDRVPVLVLAPRHVILEEIHLDSQRIDEKLEPPSLVIEGVENHADEIIVEGPVAVRQTGPDFFGVVIVGDKGHIDA